MPTIEYSPCYKVVKEGSMTYHHAMLPYSCRVEGRMRFDVYWNDEKVGEWVGFYFIPIEGMILTASLLGFVLEVYEMEKEVNGCQQTW